MAKGKKNPMNGTYNVLLRDIKERVHAAQYEAMRSVNRELVGLYWDIGRMIFERQEIEGWGKSVVEKLAEDLRLELPRIKGFSSRNIWYMRNFYSTYAKKEKLQPLVAEISWSHNLIIMEKCNSISRRSTRRCAKNMKTLRSA